MMLQQQQEDDDPLPSSSSDDEEGAEKRLKIRAVISISAPLDATAPEYRVPRPRVFMGKRLSPPRQALATIRAYIRDIPPGSIRTGGAPTPQMWELLLCIAQQAFLPRSFGMGGAAGGEGGGRRPTLEGIMETLDRREKNMVPVWIVHGRDDTVVCMTLGPLLISPKWGRRRGSKLFF